MSPVKINYKTLLAVEGQDEARVLKKYLEFLKITDVQIENVGGKDKFPLALPTVIEAAKENLETLAIIRDAEVSQEDTLKSIQSLLKKLNLPCPDKPGVFVSGRLNVGFFILPGFQQSGMLEDLFLKSLEEHPAMSCVNSFFSCVDSLSEKPSNLSKSKTLAFLSTQKKFVNKLGEAAEQGIWDNSFVHPSFLNLKSFLENLRVSQ